MKAIVRWGGGLAAMLLFTSASFGQMWVTPVTKMPYPQNPDACGPGFYVVNGCGAVYGPNYWLRPCCPPFNGILPSLKPCPEKQAGYGQVPGFPTHPYARGPRDYFMID